MRRLQILTQCFCQVHHNLIWKTLHGKTLSSYLSHVPGVRMLQVSLSKNKSVTAQHTLCADWPGLLCVITVNFAGNTTVTVTLGPTFSGCCTPTYATLSQIDRGDQCDAVTLNVVHFPGVQLIYCTSE